MSLRNSQTLTGASSVAIIGAACRLPGAPDEAAFWRLLAGGLCAVSDLPADRWRPERYWHPRRSEPGFSYSFAGGYITDPLGFDPTVFGISPREAAEMDPQQRLLLETVWSALEDGGIPPSTLAGANVGVYVGASSLDYGNQQVADLGAIDSHFMTGNTLSIVANRISYIYDLRGPSFTVDTACSSSLGGLRPGPGRDRLRRDRHGDRRRRQFAAGAVPFHRLFPRGDAVAHRPLPPVFGRGGRLCAWRRRRRHGAHPARYRDRAHLQGARRRAGVRQSIRTAAPTASRCRRPKGSRACLSSIYRHAGIDPNRLAFVEAHGTGTRVGDPSEATAIGQALAQRRAAPLPIGSVKSNIGHLEPASGLAGLFKAILALEHRVLPASLHAEAANPAIDFAALNLRLATEQVALPATGTWLAGVSSFGFGGTNAHVVIRQAEPAETAGPRASPGKRARVRQPNCWCFRRYSRPALARRQRACAAMIEAGADIAHLASGLAWQRDARRPPPRPAARPTPRLLPCCAFAVSGALPAARRAPRRPSRPGYASSTRAMAASGSAWAARPLPATTPSAPASGPWMRALHGLANGRWSMPCTIPNSRPR